VGKSLVITEKPSVARDIVSVMGQFHEHEGYWESDRYVVTYAVGHLVELMEPEDIDPAYKRWTLDQLPIAKGSSSSARSWSFSRAKSRSSASGCNR
jgi:DNA topoisomerase-3